MKVLTTSYDTVSQIALEYNDRTIVGIPVDSTYSNQINREAPGN